MEFVAHASSSAGNSYELRSGAEAPLALECGLGFKELRAAWRFSLSRLAGCVISHHHADHAKAADGLLRSGVDCYASEGCWRALGLSHHRARVLEPMRETRIGLWRVLPFEVRHDAEGTLGFLIGSPDGDRLAYVCDTPYIPYRFKGVTHWAVEANYSSVILLESDAGNEQRVRVLQNHMSIHAAAALLLANDLSATREIHLIHLSDRHSDAAAFQRTVQETTGKPVYVAPRRRDFQK